MESTAFQDLQPNNPQPNDPRPNDLRPNDSEPPISIPITNTTTYKNFKSK
jgi:hypothetical protein